MSNALPQTTPEHYLTGISALLMPAQYDDSGDWHFDACILTKDALWRVAGVNYPNTQRWFGTHGVFECSSVLRATGVVVPDGGRFYAAHYYRAILDLVMVGSAAHQSISHIRARERLHEDRLGTVFEWLDDHRDKITDPTQLRLIDQWI